MKRSIRPGERPRPARVRSPSAVAFALLLFVVSASQGCTNVKPWQREALADPIMQPNRNPVAASQLEHVYFAREAASGGTTVGGGGCGCN